MGTTLFAFFAAVGPILRWKDALTDSAADSGTMADMRSDNTRFEWDPRKAEANFRKHGISFADAVQVFYDPLATSTDDRIVDGEMRWHIVGMGKGCLLLLVVHTSKEIDDTEVIRIISARRAARRERRLYGNG